MLQSAVRPPVLGPEKTGAPWTDRQTASNPPSSADVNPEPVAMATEPGPQQGFFYCYFLFAGVISAAPGSYQRVASHGTGGASPPLAPRATRVAYGLRAQPLKLLNK